MNTAQKENTALEEARQIILQQGADVGLLYRFWFHRETEEMCLWPEVPAYQAAILDAARFESGWQVIRAAMGAVGAVVVARDGRERTVAPPEMAPENSRCLAPDRGTMLFVDPLVSGEINGFWHLWSSGWQSEAPARLQRIYVSVLLDRALDFAAKFVANIPVHATWAMKVLCGYHKKGRRDAAVVYLPVDTNIGLFWVDHVKGVAMDVCGENLPPFVSPIARGLGWAPDPGGGRSFGEVLCAAVASVATYAADECTFRTAARRVIRSLPGMQDKVIHGSVQ